MRLLLCFGIIFCLSAKGFGQPINLRYGLQTNFLYSSKDSGVSNFHSPKKAAIYSAVLPGLGQIYNKKYWKLPIVYAGIGVSVGFLIFNGSELSKTKFDLNALTDNDVNTMPIFEPDLTEEQIIGNYEFYKQNRDYSILALGVFYVLNIVDATVDAHFYKFNINKDLKGEVKPFYQNNGQKGLKFSLQF